MNNFKKISTTIRLILVVLILSIWAYLLINRTTPIVMYHAIDKTRVNNYAAVSPEQFRNQLSFIKERGYTVLKLSDYCQKLANLSAIPRHSIVITFDDGYKDNLEAAKILAEFKFPATIFVISDKLNTEGYLTTQDIQWILKNTPVEIGSHTLNHPYLPSTDDSQLKKEIADSKVKLEKMFGQKITAIAYPTGGFDKRVLKEVEQAGYLCACSTNRGFDRSFNRFSLRRVKLSEKDRGFSLWAKLSGFFNVFKTPKKPF